MTTPRDPRDFQDRTPLPPEAGGPDDPYGVDDVEIEPMPQPAKPWRRWQNWANLLLGAWLFASPWVLNFAYSGRRYNAYNPFGTAAGHYYSAAARWDAWLVGALIFFVALWALSMPLLNWPEWINAAAGLWIFISPWVFDFSDVAREAWDFWPVGALVFALAVWALVAVYRADERVPGWFFIGAWPWPFRRRTPLNP